MKRKILITGATGLVGSHVLLELLQKEEIDCYALKREQSDLSPLRHLFDWYHKTALLEKMNWIEADLGFELSKTLIPYQFDEIIHTAAVVSFNPSDYAAMERINVDATKKLLQYAQSTGVKKFGFISSIAALGRVNESGIYNEDAQWADNANNSFYSKTKYESEKIVIAANCINLETYIVNPGVILGPCDWNKSSGTFFRTGAKGIAFYTKGQNGFVDVRDVAKGILFVMHEGNSGERHVLVGESLPYRKVFSKLCLAFNKNPPKIYSPQWLTGIGWRLDMIKSRIKGSPPTLTKETARNANGKYTYDNSKMTSIGFVFTPIHQTIEDAVPFFKKYYF